MLLTEGTAFTITGSDGTVLYTADAACNTSFMIFSSAEFAGDEKVTLSAGDSQIDSTVRTGMVSTGMGGMRDHGGQRPDGEQPNGSAPAKGFDGQAPDGDTPQEKPVNDPFQKPDNSGNTEKQGQ